MRGVRGAITVESNTRENILTSTKLLLNTIIKQNSIRQEDIASIVFTMTPDLDAAFPAAAAREYGFTMVPLLDMVHPDVKGSLKKCIRALVLWNTHKSQEDIRHIYLKGAKELRPDLLEEKQKC